MDEFLKSIIREAGALAKEFFLRGVDYKTKTNLGDLVTEADTAVSDFLIEKIKAIYPDHGIYSEEQKNIHNESSEYLWMIDPIDGTRNFAHGIPMWCVMVALWYRDELIMSAVYVPLSDELFFAKAGEGAWLNNMPINVNKVDSLEYGYGAVVRGTPTHSNKDELQNKFERAAGRIATDTTVWMHNFGTMMLSVYVASGGVDFYAGNAGLDHDYAAPTLICREAGALVTDIQGEDWKRGKKDFIVANPHLHKKVLALFED